MFSFVKEVHQKQIFFLRQGIFPQINIFLSSRKFSTNKYFSFIKKFFHKQKLFMIINVFSELSTKKLSKIIVTHLVGKSSYLLNTNSRIFNCRFVQVRTTFLTPDIKELLYNALTRFPLV